VCAKLRSLAWAVAALYTFGLYSEVSLSFDALFPIRHCTD
jgi:hypothetical protein